MLTTKDSLVSPDANQAFTRRLFRSPDRNICFRHAGRTTAPTFTARGCKTAKHRASRTKMIHPECLRCLGHWKFLVCTSQWRTIASITQFFSSMYESLHGCNLVRHHSPPFVRPDLADITAQKAMKISSVFATFSSSSFPPLVRGSDFLNMVVSLYLTMIVLGA